MTSTSTTNVDTKEGASPKPRLKTSAMIASIASEGQRASRRRSATPWPSWPKAGRRSSA